ncbi:leucine-rich repeat-containing protein 24 [Anoplophora glabripennis]|uniref:leucine-rich repeat-containing protein 24 n=1 Tax=Anoplophora glabripennis TaxID=217634 RepID=UPI0008749A7B|nr:leucine-rich repeat-containing protein 24 [Anoplophora glabripennis]XP_018566483.1 leucine-rich repeat-containing protein 24 [Anoplophora glabripennis]XP_018566484.1 leucine-rich repeat-containing protein 24 [Anoplophora glabripennis]XP_018566485.1 leucine-rich repeat-containing protein 24 [Anoplophora glabripennis]
MDLACAYLFLIWTAFTLADTDWTNDCKKCECRWVSGKKTAFCSNKNLNEIPKDLPSSVREIDFSNNSLYSLGSYEFANANLRNIHKLKFQNCSIEIVNESAFNGLGVLIELDLSRNRIGVLSKDVFRDNIKLRILILSYNKIRVLDDGLLHNMTYLQKVLLNNNNIEAITPTTFQNLPVLNHIDLAFNRIQRITFDLKEYVVKLMSLNVEGNPWICDCNLQAFRQSTLKSNLITNPTECESPTKMKGRMWQDSMVFACIPEIIYPKPLAQIEATYSNITLTCKVKGDPIPDVDWVNNGHIIERDPRKSKQKYITFKNTTDGYTWNNLTITNVNYRDRGEYKCIAKNPGGEDETNITLIVPAGPLTGDRTPSPLSSSTLWIVVLSVSLLVILLIVLLLVCCFCKRNTHGMSAKRREHANSSEEYINMSSGQAEIKKGLITDVNPVTKPPRATVPPSVVSGGTEVSDVKRNLLDNESVFDGDDESRSLDFDQPLLRKSQILIESPDYRLNNHYPPDLLPFPPRGAQISPAASSASTVADTTRLPPHHGPQSPLHSPIYDQLNLYRTLPYSRSHSPFVGPPPRIPRQGYVTIPRRPRQQSWSSEPPNVSDLTPEPLYDNLGARTTADGGASTPRSVRQFPLSPSNCDPIAETHESPPSQPISSQTLPRNMNSTRLTPSRTQWAKANAEALRSPEKRNSITSLPSSPNHQNKLSKIPPTPPPKPKKRLSAGPLFQDEGEDGTEV